VALNLRIMTGVAVPRPTSTSLALVHFFFTPPGASIAFPCRSASMAAIIFASSASVITFESAIDLAEICPVKLTFSAPGQSRSQPASLIAVQRFD
jgi:hypothetical protein